MPRGHAPHRLARGDERSGYVDGENLVKRRGRKVGKARDRPGDRRVVHEHLQPAEAVHRLVSPQDGLLAAEVHLRRQCPAAGRLDGLDDRSGCALVVAEEEGDCIAALGGEPRRGGADAPAAAGDQENAFQKPETVLSGYISFRRG